MENADISVEHEAEFTGKRGRWRVPLRDARQRTTVRARRCLALTFGRRKLARCISCALDLQAKHRRDRKSGAGPRDGTIYLSAINGEAEKHICGFALKGGHDHGNRSNLGSDTARHDLNLPKYRPVSRVAIRDPKHRRGVRRSRHVARKRVEELTFLRTLFLGTGRQSWTPGTTVTTADVFASLRSEIEGSTFRFARDRQRIHVADEAGHTDERLDRFKALLLKRPARDMVPLGMVIAELSGSTALTSGRQLHCVGLRVPINVSTFVFSSTQASYPRAVHAIGRPGKEKVRVMLIAKVWMDLGGILHADSVRLELATRDFVLVDSRHEARMANWLTNHGLRFEKPFDLRRRLVFTPDFIVWCRGRVIFIEVWGCNDEKYNRKRKMKIRFMKANRLRFVQYDAVKSKALRHLASDMEETLLSIRTSDSDVDWRHSFYLHAFSAAALAANPGRRNRRI